MYKDDPNYEKWLKEYHGHSDASYPYIFSDYNEALIAFWHSDENRPFATVVADTIILYEDGCIEVYSRDYAAACATIWEWDYWKIVSTEEKK
jgi:hypothetical protein